MPREELEQAKRDAKERKESILSEYLKDNVGDLARYMKRLPKVYVWLAYEVFTVKTSLKKATKLKCLDCASFVKEDIRYCKARTCPLHPVRPYRDAK